MVDLLMPEPGMPCLAVSGVDPTAIQQVEWFPIQRLLSLVIAESDGLRSELMPTEIAEEFAADLTNAEELAILYIDSQTELSLLWVPVHRYPAD